MASEQNILWGLVLLFEPTYLKTGSTIFFLLDADMGSIEMLLMVFKDEETVFTQFTKPHSSLTLN